MQSILKIFGVASSLTLHEGNINEQLMRAETNSALREEIVHQYCVGLQNADLRNRVRKANLVPSTDFWNMTDEELRYLGAKYSTMPVPNCEKEQKIRADYETELSRRAYVMKSQLCLEALSIIWLERYEFGGDGAEEAGRETERILLRTIEMGSSFGYANLGYLKVCMAEKDPQKGPSYYKEAAELYTVAHERGVYTASPNLACLSLHGMGVDKDLNRYFELVKLSAAQGIYSEQKRLAGYYFCGDQGYCPRDLNEGLKWLKKAIYNSTRDAEDKTLEAIYASRHLVLLFGAASNAKGNYKDLDKIGDMNITLNQLSTQTEDGNEGKKARALMTLSMIFHHGLGIDKNEALARDYFDRFFDPNKDVFAERCPGMDKSMCFSTFCDPYMILILVTYGQTKKIWQISDEELYRQLREHSQ